MKSMLLLKKIIFSLSMSLLGLSLIGLTPVYAQAAKLVPLKVKTWGSIQPNQTLTILIHGGPGMGGYLEPVAQELAHLGQPSLTYTQRTKKQAPSMRLTVRAHIRDLRQIIIDRAHGQKVRLVGHSWGGVLALEFAKQYPSLVSELVLLSMGPTDRVTFNAFQKNIQDQMDESERLSVEYAKTKLENAATQVEANYWFSELSRLTANASYFGTKKHSEYTADYDFYGHLETWQDYRQKLQSGFFLKPLSNRIKVRLVHGDADPVPLALVRQGLQRQTPNLGVHVIKGAGHMPWLEEEGVSQRFYEQLLSVVKTANN